MTSHSFKMAALYSFQFSTVQTSVTLLIFILKCFATVVPTNSDRDVIFVYNCKVTINLYTPLALTRIDRSRVY